MIINIRGTSGSGKSTLMRQFIDNFGLEPSGATETHKLKYGESKRNKAFGYISKSEICQSPYKMGLAIVGDYSNDCGGCDGITTKGIAQDDIQDRIRYFRGNPNGKLPVNHVLFEGLLITHIYGRYRDMAKEFLGEFIFAGLDTPLEICKARIDERRAKQGKAPLPSHKNTEMMYNDLLKVEKKCRADLIEFVWIDHKNPYLRILNLLGIENALTSVNT